MTAAEQRRRKDDLRICGIYIIVFGIWSLIKFAMYFVFDAGDASDYARSIFSGQNFSTGFAIAACVIVFGTDIIFRLYVGLSASRESRGVKKGGGYIIFSCLLLLGSVISLLSVVAFWGLSHMSIEDMLASVIVEITHIFLCIGLIINASKLRKYKKQCLRQSEGV